MSEIKPKAAPTEIDLEQDYQRWVKIAARSSFTVALLLVILKLYAWFASNAASMLASLTDSILDLFATGLNLLILIYALKPADKEHRFGHGKAESLGGIAQAAFINGSAILLILHGIDRVFSPTAIDNADIAIYVSIVSLLLTIGLLILQRFVISKTQSVLVKADSLHYQSDILLNLGVLLAIILNQYLWQGFDGIFTALVGLYLCWGTKSIIEQSLAQLLDRELEQQNIDKITEIINKQPSVLGFHKLRTRQSGAKKFVQLHLELPADLTLANAHQITDHIERTIANELAPCEAIIHQDPVEQNSSKKTP